MNHLKLLANLHYDYFSRPTHHSVSKIRMATAATQRLPNCYLNPTCHLPHESTNKRGVRPFFSTEKLQGLPPCNRARSFWPPRFSNHRRYPPRTRESVTPQPLNPPSIDNTTQIQDAWRLSLLEFNPFAPTLPSQHRHLILRCACDLPPHNPHNRINHPTPAQCAQIQYDHLHPRIFRPFKRSTCPLRERIFDLGFNVDSSDLRCLGMR